METLRVSYKLVGNRRINRFPIIEMFHSYLWARGPRGSGYGIISLPRMLEYFDPLLLLMRHLPFYL